MFSTTRFADFNWTVVHVRVLRTSSIALPTCLVLRRAMFLDRYSGPRVSEVVESGTRARKELSSLKFGGNQSRSAHPPNRKGYHSSAEARKYRPSVPMIYGHHNHGKCSVFRRDRGKKYPFTMHVAEKLSSRSSSICDHILLVLLVKIHDSSLLVTLGQPPAAI